MSFLAQAKHELQAYQPKDLSLIEGHTGQLLLACELATGDPSIDPYEWAGKCIECLNDRGTRKGLHYGIAGMAAVFALYLDAEQTEPTLQQIDEALLPHLAKMPSSSLRSGPPGVALYAALRKHTASGHALCEEVLRVLESSAVAAEGGLVWHLPADYLYPGEAVQTPVRSFGLAHGMAGVLAGLTALLEASYLRARPLLEGALAWIVANERPPPRKYGWVLTGEVQRDAGPGQWCVGDPGVLRARYLAARACGDRAHEQAALAAAQAYAWQPFGNVDLCCGAAGVAAIYQRFAADTQDVAFEQIAARCFAETEQGLQAMPQAGLQFGRAGALLALLGRQSARPSKWGYLFGLDGPTT